MNYSQSLNELLSLGHELRGVKFDLTAIRKIAQALGNPHLQYPSVLVAGTNGKGSTASFLSNILEKAGYRTGLYTSPHLVRPNERIRVSGRDIADDDFAAAYTAVRESVNRLMAQGELPHPPSFFETLTAMAFLHFATTKATFAVLEVGMGGRLDATNFVEPRVSVITNISFDHMDFLGHTLAAIAEEKAGIIRAGVPVVSGVEIAEAAEVIRQRAAELHAPLVETFKAAPVLNPISHAGRYTFQLLTDGGNLGNISLPLAGRFQIQNASTAILAAFELRRQGIGISSKNIIEGIRHTAWPGRLETLLEEPLVILDGAHNLDAARFIAQFVREELTGRQVKLVYASMRDKAIGEIAGLLFPVADEVWITQTNQARAASPEEIMAIAGGLARRFQAEPDPVGVVNRAIESSGKDDVILVTGSLFLVGAVRAAWIQGRIHQRPIARIAPSAARN
ncbi:MAG TPA: folylpolyglutamate synthase/dihydrofolate synthase family protein [Terriglobia bacterium]|nr:folylpolyglutamate synthase/dihydrofolate synthase family protein [Terriglobia bacterium]